MAGTDQHQIRQHRNTKGFSLNFSQFVARQYWRKHWATLHRYRAHGVENGAFSSGATHIPHPLGW